MTLNQDGHYLLSSRLVHTRCVESAYTGATVQLREVSSIQQLWTLFAAREHQAHGMRKIPNKLCIHMISRVGFSVPGASEIGTAAA